MKQIMIIICAVTIAFAQSCGLSETGTSQRPSGEDIWTNPSFSTDSLTSAGTCYVTCMDYPSGYDWKSDPETGTVRCSLVVYADGRPVMKVPVGDEYNVSPDPDMHRMIGHHLYTDFSTSDETIIKKDGGEIFRYPGREMILGMTVTEGNVHTLGCPREGEGFAYRVNGEVVMERDSGRAFPRLVNENGTIWFAYCEYIDSSDGKIERYYQATDGVSGQIAIREDIIRVWDVIRHRGSLHYLADLKGISSPVVVTESGMAALEVSSGMKISAGNLVPAGSSIAVEALYSSLGVHYASGLWKNGSRVNLFGDGMTVCGICTDGDGIHCVLNPGRNSKNGIIYRSGEILAMPEGYIAMSRNAIASVNGILYTGLSSSSGRKPILWKDGITEELDINGMICSISVE